MSGQVPSTTATPAPTPAPFSFQCSTPSAPLQTLTPNTDDTYDWTKVQIARSLSATTKPLSTSPTQPIPPFVQLLPYSDPDTGSGIGTFKVDASPKWFTLVSAEFNAQGQMIVQLSTVTGAKTLAGKVVRVGTSWSGVRMPGSGKLTEYYFQIS